MARTQRADLHQRADAILDAAAELLASVEPRELRIDEVARRAGVGKGTVYLHWASREHLVLAVAAREAVAMLGTIIDAVRADPAEAALHRYMRRHFLEASRRPILKRVFITQPDELSALAEHPARAQLAATKRLATRQHLAALRTHRLLRTGVDLGEVDYAMQAVAYGFFASAPFLAPGDGSFSLEYQADRLAAIIQRSFEPSREPAIERYAAAAPQVVDAFELLREAFRRTAYGSAAD